MAGTTAMTSFSYVLAKRKNKQFRETQLLQKVLKKTGIKRKAVTPSSWLIHYGVGILFTTIFEKYWKKKHESILTNSALFGASAGLVAILVWKEVLRKTFTLKPLNRKEYFFQLFIGHVIFSLAAGYTYKILQYKKEDPLLKADLPD